jgi:hypothetical protein
MPTTSTPSAIAAKALERVRGRSAAPVRRRERVEREDVCSASSSSVATFEAVVEVRNRLRAPVARLRLRVAARIGRITAPSIRRSRRSCKLPIPTEISATSLPSPRRAGMIAVSRASSRPSCSMTRVQPFARSTRWRWRAPARRCTSCRATPGSSGGWEPSPPWPPRRSAYRSGAPSTTRL